MNEMERNEDEREMRGDDESIGGCTAFGWGGGACLSNSINDGTGTSIDTSAGTGTMTCQKLSIAYRLVNQILLE